MNDLGYTLIDLSTTQRGIDICLHFAHDCADHARQGEKQYPTDPELISSLNEIRESCKKLLLFAGFSIYCAEYAAAYVEKTRGAGQAEREWQTAHLLKLMESLT